MKILHTSDWHLGHRLYEQSQVEEQSAFLHWLKNMIDEEQIDVLLVAGDIFDTGVPSTQSQKLYYDFLVSLLKTNCKHIVITGGNHDAPGTINAPKALLNALSIKVVGKASENLADEIFELEVGDAKLIVAAVPYLRDQDIRRAVAGESFDEIGNRYKQALVNHYTDVASYCEKAKDDKSVVIAMGHLFAIGGSTSDSEQTIYIGNLGDIGANDFPEVFDYIALGHLHRPQMVSNKNHIRYSGSPYMLSFSETAYSKKVVVIETSESRISNIREKEVPRFRELKSISGRPEECIAQLNVIAKQSHTLTPWIEVILDNDSDSTIGFTEINRAAEPLPLEVLKVSLRNERNIKGLEKLLENTRHVKELSPIEVFKLKCKEMEFDLEENPDLIDAFSEVLQIANET